MRALTLSEWTLSRVEPQIGYWRPQLLAQRPIPVKTPSHVHMSLIEAGIIPDPFKKRFEEGVQWVDESDWLYRTTIDGEVRHSRQLLRFDCLDGIATISLNGEVIGSSDNTFVPFEADVTGKLRPGENVLEVRFDSAVRVGMERRTAWMKEHGLPHDLVMFDERAFVRKPGYMFGWDWGPRLVSCGIAGPVQLLDFDQRVESFDVKVIHEGGESFRIESSASSTSGDPVLLNLEPGSDKLRILSESHEGDTAVWRVEGAMWWPRGSGAQTLHTVTAEIPGDRQTKRVGLRTIELSQAADEMGSEFQFVVNGVRMWMGGANWIPNDSFFSRVTPEDYRRQIQTFADLNFRMLRVWGGGLYESEAFYDACDELGILVWQDFPFGCMYYPDDAPWQNEIRQEATHHVKRLRHRPSLALWCGNNENLVMWQQKWGGGNGSQPDRYFGENHYDKVLPEVVDEHDGVTPYIASSPIGMTPDETLPIGPERNANMGGFGDSHYWEVWHGKGDWVHYAESTARFCSEFGFASSCSEALWESTFDGEPMAPFPSPILIHHDKTGKPWDTFRGFVEKHYGPIDNMADWIRFSRLNQRDALRFGIEHFRRNAFCAGALIWQANDCWPVQSWAVQDYSRELKPAGHELKRLFAPTTICLKYVVGDPLCEVWVACDDPSGFDGLVTVNAYRQDQLLLEVVHEVKLEYGERAQIMTVEAAKFDAKWTAFSATLNDDPESRRKWILCEPKDFKGRPEAFE